MNKKIKYLILSFLIVFMGACKFMPIKTLSSKDVALSGKYKMGNSNNQLIYNQIIVFGFSVTPAKDWGVLTSEMQTKDNCAFLKNVEFQVQSQNLAFFTMNTTTVKAQCWVTE